MIIAENLHRSYSIGKKNVEVLHGLSLHIKKGEKVFLCGPSGAGKTTLMYTLAGLEPPQEGSVSINGTDIYSLSASKRALFRNKTMGFIFQNYIKQMGSFPFIRLCVENESGALVCFSLDLSGKDQTWLGTSRKPIGT